MGWDSSEGGWLGAKVYDKYDVIDFYAHELDIESTDLIDDIIENIIEDEWCLIHPYSERDNELYLSDWNDFCKKVKHEMRYMFLIKQLNREKKFKMVNANLIPCYQVSCGQ